MPPAAAAAAVAVAARTEVAALEVVEEVSPVGAAQGVDKEVVVGPAVVAALEVVEEVSMEVAAQGVDKEVVGAAVVAAQVVADASAARASLVARAEGGSERSTLSRRLCGHP